MKEPLLGPQVFGDEEKLFPEELGKEIRATPNRELLRIRDEVLDIARVIDGELETRAKEQRYEMVNHR